MATATKAAAEKAENVAVPATLPAPPRITRVSRILRIGCLALEEPPGYALIMETDDDLITHLCVAGEYAPAVTYNFPFRRD